MKMDEFYRKMHRKKLGCAVSLAVIILAIVSISLFVYLSERMKNYNPLIHFARHYQIICTNSLLLLLYISTFLFFFFIFIHDNNIFQDEYSEGGVLLLKLCFGLSSLYSFAFMEWKIAAGLITVVGFTYKFIFEPFLKTTDRKEERQRQFAIKKKSFRRGLR
ncbi:hypothetical protein LNP00_04805 [Fructobacillus sp. M158]|uniref:hypothetical protein n=1 Tax=Fructobacillus parabroussonetiae TaxID=2713174 RepID=UPI00200B58F5|nr:hypothetical protein [Fructobacillus parabroussonetiae]MCK8617684.1 hypothetical protein [Fructobacillus parabroussonetiae]